MNTSVSAGNNGPTATALSRKLEAVHRSQHFPKPLVDLLSLLVTNANDTDAFKADTAVRLGITEELARIPTQEINDARESTLQHLQSLQEETVALQASLKTTESAVRAEIQLHMSHLKRSQAHFEEAKKQMERDVQSIVGAGLKSFAAESQVVINQAIEKAKDTIATLAQVRILGDAEGSQPRGGTSDILGGTTPYLSPGQISEGPDATEILGEKRSSPESSKFSRQSRFNTSLAFGDGTAVFPQQVVQEQSFVMTDHLRAAMAEMNERLAFAKEGIFEAQKDAQAILAAEVEQATSFLGGQVMENLNALPLLECHRLQGTMQIVEARVSMLERRVSSASAGNNRLQDDREITGTAPSGGIRRDILLSRVNDEVLTPEEQLEARLNQIVQREDAALRGKTKQQEAVAAPPSSTMDHLNVADFVIDDESDRVRNHVGDKGFIGAVSPGRGETGQLKQEIETLKSVMQHTLSMVNSTLVSKLDEGVELTNALYSVLQIDPRLAQHLYQKAEREKQRALEGTSSTTSPSRYRPPLRVVNEFFDLVQRSPVLGQFTVQVLPRLGLELGNYTSAGGGTVLQPPSGSPSPSRSGGVYSSHFSPSSGPSAQNSVVVTEGVVIVRILSGQQDPAVDLSTLREGDVISAIEDHRVRDTVEFHVALKLAIKGKKMKTPGGVGEVSVGLATQKGLVFVKY